MKNATEKSTYLGAVVLSVNVGEIAACGLPPSVFEPFGATNHLGEGGAKPLTDLFETSLRNQPRRCIARNVAHFEALNSDMAVAGHK